MSDFLYTVRNYCPADFNNYVQFNIEVEKVEPTGYCVSAEVIAEILGLNVTFDERLQEHDPGVIAGMKRQEIEVHYPELVRRWHETPWRVAIPGEEDIFSFQSRVQGAMSNIVIEHADDGTVAVVAHGGTLGAYLTGLLGLDYRRRPPWVFDNASLSTVVLGGVRPRIVLLNDTCHLNHSPRRGPG